VGFLNREEGEGIMTDTMVMEPVDPEPDGGGPEKKGHKKLVAWLIVVVVILAAGGVTTGILVNQHNQAVAAQQAADRKAAQVKKAHAAALQDCTDASDALATAQSAFEKIVSDKATVAALKITAAQVADGKTVTALKTATGFTVDPLEACDTELSDSALKSLTSKYSSETDSYDGKADAVTKAVKAVTDSKAKKDAADKAAADAKAKADAQAEAQKAAQSPSSGGSYSAPSGSSGGTSSPKGTSSGSTQGGHWQYTLNCTVMMAGSDGMTHAGVTLHATTDTRPTGEFCRPVIDAYFGLPNHGTGSDISPDEKAKGIYGWSGGSSIQWVN
jgi:hypothetical protein